jgi:lipopolysaccharide export system protein LptA
MIRILVVLAALLAGPALAAPAKLASQSPIKVTADSFVVDDAARQATFTGNVVVTRSDLKLTAQKVIVHYGDGGIDDVESFDAMGNVQIDTEGQVAVGTNATFDPVSQVLVMTGNVQVTNDAGVLTGPSLTVDLKSNTTVFKGGGGTGRVTGTFTPQ